MKFIVTVFLSLLFANVYAQSESITWGPQYPVSQKVKNPIVIGNANGKCYVLRNDYKKNYLESYNESTFIKEGSVLVNIDQPEGLMVIVQTFIFNETPAFIFGTLNAAGDKFEYYLASFDPSTLTQTKLSLIGSCPYEGARLNIARDPQLFQYVFGSGTNVYFNEDNTGFIFLVNQSKRLYEGLSASELTESKVNMTYVDNSSAIVSEQNFETPTADFSIISTILADDTYLYLLGATPEKIQLLRYELASGIFVTADLARSPSEVNNYFLGHMPQGNIMVTGLLNAPEKGISGVFSDVFTADLKEVSTSSETFTTELISSSYTEDEIKENDREKRSSEVLHDYYTYGFVWLEDGSGMMFSQQFVLSFSTTVVNGMTNTSYIYKYGDIVVTKYDADGKLTWNKLIRKNQISVNDDGRYSSFYVFENGNEARVIFNEQEEDMIDSYSNSSDEKGSKRIFGNQVIISSDGNMNKTKLFGADEAKAFRLVPQSCKRINEEYLFLYTRTKNGATVMGKMKIE